MVHLIWVVWVINKAAKVYKPNPRYLINGDFFISLKLNLDLMHSIIAKNKLYFYCNRILKFSVLLVKPPDPILFKAAVFFI
ncbi:hypothetical protein BH11BAC4_BH11BAC4_16940 [soil metagenome]